MRFFRQFQKISLPRLFVLKALQGIFIFLLSLYTQAQPAQQSLEELLQQYNTQSVPYISVEELRMRQVTDSVVVLDSRETEEFEVSRIENALLVGFNHFSEEAFMEMIKDKNTPIVVYCSLGIRSEQISERLNNMGYVNVKNLYGGIFEWKNKGYPVLDKNGKETDSIHIFSKHWGQWLINGIKTTE
jgi:rhodanese-related sulfurtransferase